MRPTGLALALFLVPAVALAAGSQARAPSPASGTKSPRGPDVFGGYSYLHAGEANLNGWQLGVSFPFRGRLRWAVDLSGNYGTFAGADLSQLTFLAGVRYVRSGSRLSPFGHVLLGGARATNSVDMPGASLSASDTDWGGAIGAGADYRLGRRWAVRAQADYLLLQGEGQWDGEPRLSVGAVYRFGR